MTERKIDFNSEEDLRARFKATWNNLDQLSVFEKSRAMVSSAFEANITRICDTYLPSEGLILDIGAGSGELLRRMPEQYARRTTHVDISPTFIRALKTASVESSAIVADATQLPFSDNSFAALISLSTYHTFDELEAGVAEAKRVLKPGGRFINILDVQPAVQPHVYYFKDRNFHLFPATDTVNDFAIDGMYYAPTTEELIAFLTEKGDKLDPKLTHQIGLTVTKPLVVFSGFELDSTGRRRTDFAEWLRSVEFPGAVSSIADLFQERLLDGLENAGFAELEISDVKSVKKSQVIGTQHDRFNVLENVNGSVVGHSYSQLPKWERYYSSTIQCTTAVKPR